MTLIHIVKDITDIKIAEKLVFEAKNEWEGVFNTLSEMITIHDKDFNIIRAIPRIDQNNQITGLIHVSRDIIKSRTDDLLHIIGDILEISRIESGNASVVKESVTLNNT